jgi:hypothetical protein
VLVNGLQSAHPNVYEMTHNEDWDGVVMLMLVTAGVIETPTVGRRRQQVQPHTYVFTNMGRMDLIDAQGMQ